MSKADTTSQELVPVPVGDDGQFAQVKKWVTVLPQSEGDDEVVDRIMAKILTKTTAKAILTPDTAEGLRDFVDQEIIVHDARWRPSLINKVTGAFLIVDIEIAKTGEHKVVTTGANNVVAQICALHARGLLPHACKVIETASNTDAKNKIQWLVSAEAF